MRSNGFIILDTSHQGSTGIAVNPIKNTITAIIVVPRPIPKNNPNILSTPVKPVLPNNFMTKNPIPVRMIRLTTNRPINARIPCKTGEFIDSASIGAK